MSTTSEDIPSLQGLFNEGDSEDQIQQQHDKLMDNITLMLSMLPQSAKTKLAMDLGATHLPSSQAPFLEHQEQEMHPGSSSVPMPKYMHMEIPRLPNFSGAKPSKGEVTYSQWRYGVQCLYLEKTWPASAIQEAIRRSLRGMAAETMISLGMQVSVKDLIGKLDSTFGTVATPEQLIEEFYVARQEVKESIAEWGCRLSGLASKAGQAGAVTAASIQDMLRCKFFSGLVSHDVKSSIRHRFDGGASYEVLLRAARQIEDELAQEVRRTTVQKTAKASQQQQATKQQVTAKDKGPNLFSIEKQLGELVSQVRALGDRVNSVESRPRPAAPTHSTTRHCYECGNPAHLRSECPLLGRGRHRNYQQNRNYNQDSQNLQQRQGSNQQKHQQNPLNW